MQRQLSGGVQGYSTERQVSNKQNGVHGYLGRSMSSPAKTCYLLCRRAPLVHARLTAPPRTCAVSVLLSRVENRIPRCSLRRGVWRPGREDFRSSLATEQTKPCRNGDFHMCVLCRAGGHDTDQGTPPADPRWSGEILTKVDFVKTSIFPTLAGWKFFDGGVELMRCQRQVCGNTASASSDSRKLETCSAHLWRDMCCRYERMGGFPRDRRYSNTFAFCFPARRGSLTETRSISFAAG